jgi:hypothetical protein
MERQEEPMQTVAEETRASDERPANGETGEDAPDDLDDATDYGEALRNGRYLWPAWDEYYVRLQGPDAARAEERLRASLRSTLDDLDRLDRSSSGW